MRHFPSASCVVVLVLSAGVAAQEPKERAVLKGHRDSAFHLAFSPDGKLLASCGEPRVKVWDVATAKEVATFEAPEEDARWGRSVAFSPDGKSLVFSWDTGTIQSWDAIEKGKVTTLGLKSEGMMALAYASGGRILAFPVTSPSGPAASHGTSIQLWDLAAQMELAVLTGHTRTIFSIAVSPDDKTLVSAGDDRTVRLWNLGARRQRAVLEGHKAAVWVVAIAPDGRTVASGDEDGVIKFWGARTGELQATVKGHGARVTALAFTPDGKTLASTGFDRMLRLWDTVTHAQRSTLEVPGGRVRGVAFTRDGRTMATGNADGKIRLWDLADRMLPLSRSPVKPDEGAKDTRPSRPEPKRKDDKPIVVREEGRVTKIIGKVQVLDAHTLRYEDGTELELNGGMDAPDLDQQALLGDALYPWGKEAAEFLRKRIGDRAVTGYAGGRTGTRLRATCFVDETNLEIEMVRNGWAVSHHSGMDAWQMIASENRRGIWRGKFIEPERWRKGDRLPGEPGERESERKALAALQRFEPIVTVDRTKPGKPVIAIQFRPNTLALADDDLVQLTRFLNLRSVDMPSCRNVTDAGLEHITGLRHLLELNLNWTKVTPDGVVRAVRNRRMMGRLEISGVRFRDEDLAMLKGLPNLRTLNMRATLVTDKGLEHLKPFENLQVLSLMSTGIGDTGLKHLASLTSLEDLDLDRTAITDAGLIHLKGLRNLRRLQMAHTAVSDAGLEHLLRLSKLMELNVRGTTITRKAAEKLRERIPGLQVGLGPAPR